VLALASLSPRDRTDHAAARVVASHAAEQRWSLLCNGVVLFEDTGELLPSGAAIPPHRWGPRHSTPLIAAPSAA
jgi:Family of unknown function (DUF5999)